MLKTSFLFCFLFSCYFVFSQIPFEGKISYKLTMESENRSGTVEVLYGKQKIKGVMKDTNPKTNDDHVVIINFSQGIIYSINDSSKTFSADSLKTDPENRQLPRSQKTGMKKDILGKACSAFSFNDSTKKTNLNGAMDFLLWYADSLYFPVSEQYRNTDDIMMFTNGKNIGMGMTMNMDVLGKKAFLNLEPIQIEVMPLADSLFELPEGYALKKADLQGEEKLEIKLSEIKRDGPPPPPPPPPPAIPKKKIKH